VNVEIVIPTSGRPSLTRVREQVEGRGVPVIVTRDSTGRGPAATRNSGWRQGTAEWVAFLDDDVVPPDGWVEALLADLAAAGPGVGGSQGRIVVPVGERPTDWERNVAGLETARWATADIAYRRTVLEQVGGFDERFPRAYREDADLGLRVSEAGWEITRGKRWIEHPVGPAPGWVSLLKQAGNADDPLMFALHGRGWRGRAGVPAGRRPGHVSTALLGLLALRRRLAPGPWALGTAELAWARIAPGPRTPSEVWRMVWTSILMPFLATGWWIWGWAILPWRLRAPGAADPQDGGRPAAVLFDRDGTLVEDVPYNGDPARVRPLPGAREALERLRAAGVPTAVVSNQSGIARGLITDADVRAVNARIEELLGPLGPWLYCPHGPDDGCPCRKPAPDLVRRAAEALGVDPGRCVVVGDIGADVEAARAAGARSVLVPTARTLPEEVRAAPVVARDIRSAVDLVLRL
jgi:histidinol-phosphate phosphatase family protein